MSSSFAVHLPHENAFSRRMLFAAQLLDAVTLEPVIRGVAVQATGLQNQPIVNCDRFFVWLEEGDRTPQQVVVDATGTPYESISVPAPVLPARSVRIELAPKFDYPFAPGITAMRGTLLESLFGPRTPVVAADIWLQWIDADAGGTTWIDAPTHSHSGVRGDFAALLRLTPAQVPRSHASGGLSARLRVRREGATRSSAEFSLPEGRVADALPAFTWSELVP